MAVEEIFHHSQSRFSLVVMRSAATAFLQMASFTYLFQSFDSVEIIDRCTVIVPAINEMPPQLKPRAVL